MNHEELCKAAYAAYINTLVAGMTGTPSCFSPLAWWGLDPLTREAFSKAVLEVQQSKSKSPKREAYAAYQAVLARAAGPKHTWEQLPESLRKAWAAFTNFVIKEGALN